MFIWLIGFIVAVVRWKQSPRKSMLVVVGLIIMTLGGITDIANYILPENFSPSDVGPQLFFTLMRTFTYAGIFFNTVGWIVCIFAIFSPDKKAE
jgi:hypothetical protein